jgi:putative ABC transport system substrate-binding protein
MRRREFIAAAIAASTVRRSAAAQPVAKSVRIGWVSAQEAPAVALFLGAFRTGLAEFGYFEGRNLLLTTRYADDQGGDRVAALAWELERLPVDVLMTQGPATFIVSKLGLKVPVVYSYSGDPVEAGFADSLARPKNNMTGQTFMSVELNGKRLEVLREMLPSSRRVAIIANPIHPGEHLERADSEGMARQLDLAIQYLPTKSRSDLEGAFVAMTADRPDALVLFPDGLILQHRQRIVDFATSLRVPVLSGWAVIARSGALFTYGPRLEVSFQRLAYYVDRILKGAKTADIPIERPKVLELVINLKTAKALGITVPQSLLARADEVIE